MPKERRFNLRTDDEELEAWRRAAAVDGIPDLATWFRRLATREIERQRRRAVSK